jgi:pantoate--beta-alanine ligase
MEVLRTPSEVRFWVNNIRRQEKTVGFVPTMGALHKAHGELITRSVEENDLTIVSIFVNPTQFGTNEDFSGYPRTFEADSKLCEEIGADLIFYPEASEMYGEAYSTTVKVTGITDAMCGANRPGHFEGVATVVSKLFNIVKPHKAYFGQKDYQQYIVIDRLVNDLNFDLELVMHPIVRDENGLALSSRNKYLSETQKEQAPIIYKSLTLAAQSIEDGLTNAAEIKQKIISMITDGIPESKIDYVGIYDPDTLSEASVIEKNVVLAAAVWVGKARLIDNVILKNERN